MAESVSVVRPAVPKPVKEIWAVRCPGGPTKILKSSSPLTEEKVKKLYLKSFSHRQRDDSDPDAPWPLLQRITENDIRQSYQWCIEESALTGCPRALIEV